MSKADDESLTLSQTTPRIDCLDSKKESALQPRDALTDNLATHFPDRSIIFDEPDVPSCATGAAVVRHGLCRSGSSGAGKRGRALLFFLTIVVAFVLG